MQATTAQQTIWRIDLSDETATLDLAQRILPLIGPNDLVTLSGDLGAGKTTFARALIRLLTGEAQLEVPSPTFTLMQVYQTPAFPVVHADLYRINDPSELAELGWEEAADGALLIVEWAEKAGALPADLPLLLLGDRLQAGDVAGARAQADRLEADGNLGFLVPVLRGWIGLAIRRSKPASIIGDGGRQQKHGFHLYGFGQKEKGAGHRPTPNSFCSSERIRSAHPR
jgi:tRNA threonylcarbamoyl adenosine modification protein YjeE